MPSWRRKAVPGPRAAPAPQPSLVPWHRASTVATADKVFCSDCSKNVVYCGMGRLKEFDEDKAIDGAVDCFWARGYEATSVRDLAHHMGIGGASLYNAYGGKRALFVAALERYADRSSRERIARLEAGGQPKQAIEAFLAEIVDRSLRDRERKGCLLVNSALDVAPHDAEIGKVVAGYLEEIRAF